MLGLCLRYAKTTFEAEDMLQAGFIKVFQQMDSFRGEGSFEGWIRRVMVNIAISTYRKRQRGGDILDITQVEEMPSVSSGVIDQLAYEDLLSLVQELPEGYRIVFNLHIMEGFAHKEIADMLNISESTSKTQLMRARSWLQKRIKKMEGVSYGE